MKTLLALVLLPLAGLAPPARAARLNIKPGLWEVQMKIKSGGKEFDPQEKMREAMRKMSPEQRKRMMEAIGKSGGNLNESMISGKGLRVCYTPEMLARPESISQDPQGKCKSTVTNQSSTKVDIRFECEDGTSGTGTWEIHGSESFNGRMKMARPQARGGQGGAAVAAGKDMEMSQSGKYVGADCGGVKPFDHAQARANAAETRARFEALKARKK